MKAQKLKTLTDFLKRAELLPQAFLVVTYDEFYVEEIREIIHEVPFYELNLSEHPQLKEELEANFDLNSLPAIMYFRKEKFVGQTSGFNFSSIASLLNSSLEP